MEDKETKSLETKSLKDYLEDDPSLTEKITYEEFEKRTDKK